LNAFGREEIDGYGLANRLYGYLGIFEAALSSSLMFYAAQNYGKKDPVRLKKGLIQSFILGVAFSLISIGIGFLLRDSFYALFFKQTDHPDNYASYQTTLLYFLPSFFLSIILNGFRSFFYGVNRPLTAFLSTVVETSFRLLFALVLTPHLGFYGVPLSDMVAWGATSLFCVIAYLCERGKIYGKKPDLDR
jgi:Na+-driven multidrug efflux pump